MKVFRSETLGEAAYDEIVALLRSGGIIAFPTDTSYGLGTDPFNEYAVARIFEVKGRAETKPILVLVDSLAMAQSISEPLDAFQSVAEEFWPGPLTVIVRALPFVPSIVTAGTKTIGIRWPKAPVATSLVTRLGKPITATSANHSGGPAAVTADEVRAQFGERTLDAVIDGGPLPARAGSTVLDLTVDPAVVLREGPITFESLRDFFKGRIRRQVS